MMHRLIDRLLPMPISEPAVWGKLPAHGDYLSRGALPLDIAIWRRWFAIHPLSSLWESAPPIAAKRALPAPAGRWLSTDPPNSFGKGHSLPWCFLIPADALPASGGLPNGRLVIGVMAHSCDQAGRLHPLVVWHSVTAGWLLKSRHAEAWLFWLAALVNRHVLPSSTPEVPNTSPFLAGLEQLWRVSAPGLSARFGAVPAELDEGALQALIAEATPRRQAGSRRSATDDLVGVKHLPWADWPGVAVRPGEPGERWAYFWQHAANGEYVGFAAPPLGTAERRL